MSFREAAWKDKLLALPKIIRGVEGGARLRHGVPYVCVSHIAKQFFCEKKVEMMHVYGKVETEVMQEGEQIHKQIMKMERMSVQRLIEEIESKRAVFASFPVFAEVEGLPVAGIPDSIGITRGEWFASYSK